MSNCFRYKAYLAASDMNLDVAVESFSIVLLSDEFTC